MGDWTILRKDEQAQLSAKHFIVGLGWDVASQNSEYDLDASVFMVTDRGTMRSPDDLIYYNRLKSQCGGVTLTGDNRTGEGDGDDEQLIMDLTRVPPAVSKLIVVVNIYDAASRRQSFREVRNAFCHLFVPRSFNSGGKKFLPDGQKLVRYNLAEEYANFDSVVVCEIFRASGGWTYKAVGKGFNGGLDAAMKLFRP